MVNRSVKTSMRCFAGKHPKAWAQFLAWVGFLYNSSFHSAIKISPFQAVYGREPLGLLRYETGSTTNTNLERQLHERDQMVAQIKEHLHRAQQCMKAQVNVQWREVQFEVGDSVFLKLRPYRQKSLAMRAYEKLAPRFYGPFKVEAKIGEVAYRVKPPAESKIHPTFHVSQLKKAIKEHLVESTLPDQLTLEGILQVEPEHVLDTRSNPRSRQEEVPMKWKELPDYECSWEIKVAMEKKFPTFNVEDKVGLEGVLIGLKRCIHQRSTHTRGRRSKVAKGKIES